MSMFKSLQSIPSTITVFHSSKSPVSSSLVSLLQKNSIAKSTAATTKSKTFFQRLTSSSSDERPDIYQLDITESIPTVEQYDSIRETVARTLQNKESFIKLFPKFGGGNLPSATEYELKLQHETSSTIFQPPLVVDWDHGLLGTDTASVQKIIDVFQNNTTTIKE